MERSQRVGLVVVAVVLAAILGSLNSALEVQAAEYAVTDLTALWQNSGLFPEESGVWTATALNDRGQVVGSFEEHGTSVSHYALLWDEQDGLRELGNLGATASASVNINDSGQVVGCSSGYPFLWSDSTGMTSLGSLDPSRPRMLFTDERANDVNDQGVVVGWGRAHYYVPTAFVWTEEAGIRPIDGLADLVSNANAINSDGQVVGWCAARSSIARQNAFLWDSDSGVQSLPLLGDAAMQTDSYAYDINDLGDIIGGIYFLGEDSRHAVLWRDGDVIDLGNLGVDFAWANAINDRGVIVGHCDIVDATGDPGSHAFIWDQQHGMRDLNDLIEPMPDTVLFEALDINNNGWILATAGYADPVYLLKPVPEPSCTALLISVVLCLSLFFRARRMCAL